MFSKSGTTILIFQFQESSFSCYPAGQAKFMSNIMTDNCAMLVTSVGDVDFKKNLSRALPAEKTNLLRDVSVSIQL